MIVTNKQIKRGAYVAPASEACSLSGSSIICDSGDFSIEDWQEDTNPINF